MKQKLYSTAMALMALGLGDVEPVDVLCGAGNKYVVEAKRQLLRRLAGTEGVRAFSLE